MTAEVMCLSVPPLSNRGLAPGTNTAPVGCTEGGGGRLVGFDNPSVVVLAVGMK